MLFFQVSKNQVRLVPVRIALLSLLVSLVAVISPANMQSANAVGLATCSVGSSAQNSIAVEPSHPTVMYIDSGMNPRVDAGYVGYRISNRTGVTLKGYWASLDNFSGGVVSLANPLDKYIALPEIANNETKTVYFLLKASTSTKTIQAHDFKVWDSYPGATTALNKYGCNFGFSKVAETIKAAANKPTSTVVSTVGAIGTTFTVTSEGGTGTIGAGNPDVGRILWFTPSAYSSFPTRAFRLESVVLKVGTKSNFQTNSGEEVRFYKDRTFVKTNTLADADASFTGEVLTADGLVGKRFYSNVYTFRVIDAATTSIVPVAQISSGTQIKHSVIAAAGTDTINSSASTIPATISKVLVSTSYSTFETPTISGVRYTAVPYKVTLTGANSTSVTADQIVDYPASGAIYKIGSTTVKIGGTTISTSDPETFTSESAISPQPLHFIGPFVFNNTSLAEITYTMYIPSTAGTYTNSASGYIGDRRIISSTTAAIPAVNVTVNGSGTVTGSTTSTKKLLPEPLTKIISAIDTSTATINGSINANDTTTAGYFEWSSSPTLATYTSVSLGAITGNTATSKSSNLSGLSAGSTYYYRIVAVSFGVRYEGAILDFRTLDQKATPTITTDAPTNVSLSDATLNATVDPNLTEVQVAFKIWRTNDTATVWVLDDPSLVENNTVSNADYNPKSLFSGASPTSLSIKMTDVATNLSSWIANGATIYYRAEILTTTGAVTIAASETKQFTFATYNDQVLTFDPISDITWGAAAPSESASATSRMAVTFTSQTTDVCTVDGSGNITVLKVGICSIAANQPGGQKTAGIFYNPSNEVIQSFTINPRPITITADAKSKNYNAADPSLTYSITSGTLVNAGDVTGSLTRATGENIGTYLISQGSVAGNSNYTVTYASANLTINALAITITAAAKTKVFGQSDPSLTYSISPSLKVGDPVSGALSRNVGESVGSYTINQNTLAVSNNYSVTYASANLTISAKPLTIKAESKTRASGQSQPSFTYTLSGLTGSDSITAVTLTFTSAAPYNSTTPPTVDGSYVITPSAETFGSGSASNYTITYETGTYTITSKTPQALTWTSISTKTYGDTATATVSSDRGLPVTVTSLTPSICTVPSSSVSGATVTILGAGTCQLNASQAGDTTYAAATDATTSFTINPKPVTIAATISATPKNYGDASATTGYARTALVGSDEISGITNTFTSSSPSYNSTSVPTLVGTYTLTPSAAVFSTGSAANYTITYTTTGYVINKKALTITASSHSVTEGDPVPTITGSYSTFAYSEGSSDLTGTLTCSTVYTTSSAAGSYASTCSGKTSDNYTITYVDGSITVSAAGGTTYTITYDINGGLGTTPTESPKSNGQTFTTPTTSGFSRNGFTLSGWSCNSVATGISVVVTVGTANITCVAIWTRNSSSSNSNNNNNEPAKPVAVKKIAIASLVTIATTPVKTTISVVPASTTSTLTPAPKPSASPAPSASATPKPSASPAPGTTTTPKPTPTPSASSSPATTPTPTPTPGASSSPSTVNQNDLPEGVTLSKTTVIPTVDTKSMTFKGVGISKVAVVNEEVSVAAKPGFSGKTVVTITLKEDEEISIITADVLVIPLPVTNPVVKEVTEDKTRISWVRSPNAIGYEVVQNGVLLCTTKGVSCTLDKGIPAKPPVEIKALGKDQTESVIREATYVAAPERVVPDIALVVNFDTAKYALDTTDRILIQNFASDIKIFGFKEVDISGHTDSRGGIDNNILSINRAKASRDYLLKLVPGLKVTINGYADVISVAPNSTVEGMAANRRAEFRVVK